MPKQNGDSLPPNRQALHRNPNVKGFAFGGLGGALDELLGAREMHDKEFDLLTATEVQTYKRFLETQNAMSEIVQAVVDARQQWMIAANNLVVATKNRAEGPHLDLGALRAVPSVGSLAGVYAIDAGRLNCDACKQPMVIQYSEDGLFYYCQSCSCRRLNVRLRRKPVEMEIVQGQVGAGQLEKAKA